MGISRCSLRGALGGAFERTSYVEAEELGRHFLASREFDFDAWKSFIERQ